MLVAAEKGAYGKAKQSIFVRQPLIMQATMPRVLSPNEEVSIPVALFVMKEGIKDVKLEIIVDDFFTVMGEKSKIISFDKIGEKLGMLRLKTNNKAGKGHIRFIASSGEYKTTSELYINIRQANQPTTRISTQVIEPGESWTQQIKPHGLEGSNQAILELSSVPALHMEKHLDYLMRYPHGCLEQTTSSVFPQLYLSKVMQLSEEKQKKVEHHIKRAIDRLRSFQLATGDFSYWPSGNNSNEWASIYAGHFLVEAQKLGYLLPAELLTDWLSYQTNTAQRWLAGSNTYTQTQAYRLNVLALAGKPQMGAMNRLRKSGKLSQKARWMLASAYQIAGQPEAANSLIEGLIATSNQQQREESAATFSSKLGDLGIQLSNLVALNKNNDVISGVDKLAAGYEHFLVKFSQTDDLEDAGAIEYVYSLMAKQAGIEMPETRLIAAENQQRYFAIKRFDRDGDQRIHTHTLGGLIHADHRIPACDYETYLQVTKVLTQDNKAIEQAFKRMLFNIFAHNRDDHVKNFSFMLNQKWQLTPAYDLMPTQGMGGEHSMSINGKGKNPNLKDLQILAEQYNINNLIEMIEQVKEAVLQWRNLAQQNEIKTQIINHVEKLLKTIL
jgi:hypothetical protein